MCGYNVNPTYVSSYFLVDLGCKISERSGDPLDGHFLFEQISVLIQCVNLSHFHKIFQLKMGLTCSRPSLF